MERPPSGRSCINSIVDLLPDNPRILEIGMTRLEGNYMGDGYSTVLFAWCVANTGGCLLSIDIDPQPILVSTKIIKDYQIPLNNIHLVCSDAIQYIKNFPIQNIDLLYLDAWDWYGSEEDKRNSEEKHLEFFKLVESCLSPSAFVMIDDIFDSGAYTGKGALLIPYMMESGKYSLLEKGYQFLFRKTGRVNIVTGDLSNRDKGENV